MPSAIHLLAQVESSMDVLAVLTIAEASFWGAWFWQEISKAAAMLHSSLPNWYKPGYLFIPLNGLFENLSRFFIMVLINQLFKFSLQIVNDSLIFFVSV